MANNRVADSLLKWGLRNSEANPDAPGNLAAVSADIASGKRPDLADPGLYNAIMGKSEAQMMQEELAAALDTSRTEQDRCTALDNFEMLVEQVDNANNIASMKMWQPVLSLLDAPATSIQIAAAWIVGTAVQNNDKAQMAVLEHKPLPRLLELLEHSPDAAVRSKAMYALSAILRHNPAAVQLFQEKGDGWRKLQAALGDPDISLRRKTAFLINSLLLQDDQSKATTSNSSEAPTTTSQATGIAPMVAPGAPTEQLPATQRAGVSHPDVARALIESGLLQTLISSILPPPSAKDGWESVTAYGPDGDQEARHDIDYAEKAFVAIVNFVHRLQSDGRNLQNVAGEKELNLLRRAAQELKGKPLDSDGANGADTRWKEVGLDTQQFGEFERALQS